MCVARCCCRPFNARVDPAVRIALTGIYFVVELVAGVWLDSLSLQADAFHMASDIMGLLIALFAENVKGAKKTKLATYGYVRADAVGSLINTTFLLSTCFTIAIDALARFREVDELAKRMEDSGIPLLIVASIGLGINIIGLLCFGDQMHVVPPRPPETFQRSRIALGLTFLTFFNTGTFARGRRPRPRHQSNASCGRRPRPRQSSCSRRVRG